MSERKARAARQAAGYVKAPKVRGVLVRRRLHGSLSGAVAIDAAAVKAAPKQRRTRSQAFVDGEGA